MLTQQGREELKYIVNELYPVKKKIYLTKKQKKRGETPWAKYHSMESIELDQELDKAIAEVRKELKGKVVDPDFQVRLKDVNFTPYNQSEVQKQRKEERRKEEQKEKEQRDLDVKEG